MAKDLDRLQKIAAWLKSNQAKRGSPEWDKMAAAYNTLSQQPSGSQDSPNSYRGFGDNMAEAGTASFVQGTLAGFADEAMGGIGAALSYPVSMISDRVDTETAGKSFGDRYEMYRDRARNEFDDVRSDFPVTSTVGEIGGAVVGTAIPASKGLTAFKGANTLPQMMRAGAIDGAAYGALHGAGYADGGLMDRGKGALTGGTVGSVTGGGLPVVTKPISGAAQAFIQRFSPAENQAANRVANAAKNAGMTSQDVAAKMRDLGDEAMLIDALGTQGRELGRATTNASPAAYDTLYEKAILGRREGQTDRMVDSIADASGLNNPMTLQEIKDEIVETRQPAITRAYEDARAKGFDINLMPFRDLFRLPMFKRAVKSAKENQLNYLPDERSLPGRLGFLDEVKKELDVMANQFEGRGDTTKAFQAANLARVLRERIDDGTPEYGGARALAQAAFNEKEAAALGARGVVGGGSKIPADFARRVDAVDETARPALAKGYGAAAIDAIQTKRGTPGALETIFGPRRAAQALNAALGPRAQTVQRQLDRERTFGATANALAGNSTTAKQLMNQLGLMSFGGAAGLATSGGDPTAAGVTAATLPFLRYGGGRLLSAANVANEAKVAPIVAKLLAGEKLPAAVQEKIATNPVLQEALSRAAAAALAGQSSRY